MNDPNELLEVTDPEEISAIGAPGLAGWINGGWNDGKWWAYRYSLERFRQQREARAGSGEGYGDG